MVEKYVEQFKPLGVPALVTSPTLISDTICPSSWIVNKDATLTVFEFSTHPLVSEIRDQLKENQEVLRNLTKLIIDNNMEDIISLAILGLSNQDYFKERSFSLKNNIWIMEALS